MKNKSLSSFTTPLGNIGAEQFIKKYWQQKTLVIRQGFKNFTSPISAEELAGLACEEDVHSRIVVEKGGDRPWQLINGPMTDAVFAALPETHWTLLVNDVEKHLPALAKVVDAFRFIPEWRVDDLMISFAPEGGTVGPHLDQYDVFILQAQGHRRWQISTEKISADNQIADTALRIHKDFTAEQEWLLAPGDIIYIPSGVTHYGVATDDCLSFSIGFRAPTHAEMLTNFIDFISQDLPVNKVYKDKKLKLQLQSNEITTSTIENIREIFSEYLNTEHHALAQWFGRFVSDTKTDLVFENEDSFTDFADLIQSYPILYRNPASRFAFYDKGSEALLFVDGNELSVSSHFAKILCAERSCNLNMHRFNEAEQRIIMSLYNTGQLMPQLYA